MNTKKSFLAALTAMCAMTMTVSLTSCSQSDNPVGPANGTTITVNTAALYQELGLTDRMNGYLANNELYYILGHVFLYDQQGNLVTQLSGKARNLEPMVLKGDGIADGTYTLVAFQAGEQKEHSTWEVVDADRLADVHLSLVDDYFLNDMGSIGLASLTVTVRGGRVEAIVTPKAAGCIVETRLDNFFDGDRIKALSLNYEGHVTGIYLDPARSGNDRLIMDNVNYFDTFSAGYGKRLKEGSSSWKDFSPYCGENVYTAMIGLYEQAEPGPVSDVEEIAFLNLDLVSGKHVVVYHDFDQNQLYKTYAGSEEGLDSWLARRAENPYEVKLLTKFGATLADVERFMNQEYKWWPDHGIPIIELIVDGKSIWRKNYDMDNLAISYDFYTADGQGLHWAMFTYYGDQIPLETMQREIERQGYILDYVNQPESDGEPTIYYYMLPEGNSEVLLRQHIGQWDVCYCIPSTYSSRNLTKERRSLGRKKDLSKQNFTHYAWHF